MTRGSGDPADVIAEIRRRLRNTHDPTERQHLEDELLRLERGVLDGELGRLSSALELSEKRRRTAERTLAAVATDAAAKLLSVQAQRDEAIAERDELRRQVSAPPRGAGGAALGDVPFQAVPRGRAWRALVVLALIVGILVVIDGVVTTVWEEPISALVAMHQQHKASKELKVEFAQPEFAALRKVRSHAWERYRAAERMLNDKSIRGHALARLKIPKIGLSTVVIEGTKTGDLVKGPGHYLGTMLPGLPGTFAIAGHRTTFLAPFRNLDKLGHGSRIFVLMPYGRFEYRVTSMYSTTPANVRSIIPRRGHSKLVLTACDPPGSASKRLVVIARPISA